ncbi:unnamed protein product [Acanthoscelides obtectus]|uniref:Uncharacterized protein n=1 Tax=Acanthoscelides obtectus TaxID=200917 RepID=A0A9P0L4W5_ACAOB|nr:unnamed protein product [Acanthoscelides obtectus]CAK1676845.1 Protein charybde [Acanthoscelides obtectus]
MEVLPITNVKYNTNKIEDSEWEFTTEFPESEESPLVEALSQRLEAELRTAKRSHLSVGEVLLPNGLTREIAERMFRLADSEPCGLRGCTLYIDFDSGDMKTKLSTIKCDPATPSTFEVYLTLKQATAGWNFLPQFIKKITRGSVMISPDYELSKKKLYRSSYD